MAAGATISALRFARGNFAYNVPEMDYHNIKMSAEMRNLLGFFLVFMRIGSYIMQIVLANIRCT